MTGTLVSLQLVELCKGKPHNAPPPLQYLGWGGAVGSPTAAPDLKVDRLP